METLPGGTLEGQIETIRVGTREDLDALLGFVTYLVDQAQPVPAEGVCIAFERLVAISPMSWELPIIMRHRERLIEAIDIHLADLCADPDCRFVFFAESDPDEQIYKGTYTKAKAVH